MAEYAQYVNAFASALLSCNGRDAIANGGSRVICANYQPFVWLYPRHFDLVRVAARTVAALLQTGNAEVRRAVEQVSAPDCTLSKTASN